MDEWVVVEDVITVMDKIKYNLEEVKKKNLTSDQLTFIDKLVATISSKMNRYITGLNDPERRKATLDLLYKVCHLPPPQGVLPVLLNYIDDPDVHEKIVDILLNYSAKYPQAVADAGAIPVLVRILEMSEEAVWAIGKSLSSFSKNNMIQGNIGSHSIELRDTILSAGALRPLLNRVMRLQHSKECMSKLGHGIFTLSQLCSGKPVPEYKVIKPVLWFLTRMTNYDNVEIKTVAALALEKIAEDGKGQGMW